MEREEGKNPASELKGKCGKVYSIDCKDCLDWTECPAVPKIENSERVCPEKCERPEDNDKIKNPCIHEENGLCKTKEECIHKKLDTTKGARFISAGTFEFKLKDKIGKAPSPEKVVYEEPEPIGTIAEQEMTEKEPRKNPDKVQKEKEPKPEVCPEDRCGGSIAEQIEYHKNNGKVSQEQPREGVAYGIYKILSELKAEIKTTFGQPTVEKILFIDGIPLACEKIESLISLREAKAVSKERERIKLDETLFNEGIFDILNDTIDTQNPKESITSITFKVIKEVNRQLAEKL